MNWARLESLRDLSSGNWREGRFFRKSSILNYAYSDAFLLGVPIKESGVPGLRSYILEQSFAMMRMFQISIMEYESLVESQITRRHSHASAAASASIIVTSGYASIEAAAAMICAIISGSVPKQESQIPGISIFKNDRFPVTIRASVNKIYDFDWFKHLEEARHRILHRGFWPMRLLDGTFLVRRAYSDDSPWHRLLGYEGMDHGTREFLDLQAITLGLMRDFEQWDLNLQAALESSSKITPKWVSFEHYFNPLDRDYAPAEVKFEGLS